MLSQNFLASDKAFNIFLRKSKVQELSAKNANTNPINYTSIMTLVSSINYNRSLPHLIRHFQIANKLVLGWDCFFSSVPVSVTIHLDSCSSTVPVLVPRFSFWLLNTRVSIQTFHRVIYIFLIFGTGLIPFRYHFGSKSDGTWSFSIGT